MKAVLISIKPKWCELIVRKEKTIEVRKTRPKIETPFKCYIYCTNPNTKNPNEVLEIHGAVSYETDMGAIKTIANELPYSMLMRVIHKLQRKRLQKGE